MKTFGKGIIEPWEEWRPQTVFFLRERDSMIDPLENSLLSSLLALDLASDKRTSIKQPKL